MKYLFFSLVVFAFCQSSCKHKHNHELSVELKQAFEIQQSALRLNDSLNVLLEQISDSVKSDELTQRRDNWLNNMVEIPGANHDHSGCSHDHKKIDFALTDQEMISVQQEWRDSLHVMESLIKSLLQ